MEVKQGVDQCKVFEVNDLDSVDYVNNSDELGWESDIPYVGKFWRINGSKVFGKEKFGKSVGSLLKTLAFINIGEENFGELPAVCQKFSPSKIFPCTVKFWEVEKIAYPAK